MTWLRTMLVVAMAVLWLPISVHCELEEIPALQFFSCCPDDNAAPHQDADCETDVCAVVESGLYKAEERQASIPAPQFFGREMSDWLGEALIEAALVFEDLPHSTPPPELPAGWRFVFRTALPPRAPSLVS